MAFGDPRYIPVNTLHALGYPPCSRHEAEQARKILFHEFGKLTDACALRATPMWKNMNIRQDTKRCWVSLKPTTGDNKGWGRLVHDIGHRVYAFRNPKAQSHGPGEEHIEMAVAEYVRANFLKGELKLRIKAKPDKLLTLNARLESWQKKAKRAENAIKKLNKQVKYYERKQNAKTED